MQRAPVDQGPLILLDVIVPRRIGKQSDQYMSNREQYSTTQVQQTAANSIYLPNWMTGSDDKDKRGEDGEDRVLDRPDVDLDQGILTIRRTKFGKSRHVPVHPSTVDALRKYAETRDRILAKPTPAFFVSERGTRITDCIARYTFARLSQQLGLRSIAKSHGHGPRLHDMRHRFAARTLIHWYRAGLDVERELPKLATYLGHVHVNETYWYLEAVPELLQLATDRLLNNAKKDRS